MKNILKFLKEIKVYDCHNMTKSRVGHRHDGGYIVLSELCKNTGGVYSFGVEKDVGFELDFAKRFKCEKIKLFDPTINSLPDSHKSFEFFRMGVGPRYTSLKNIMYGQGLTSNLTLKMDIEWDEWQAILDSDDKTLSKFSQVLIEFHIVDIERIKACDTFELTEYFKSFYDSAYDKINDNLFAMYYNVLKKLNDMFYIFHTHANNSLAKISVDGFSFPPLIEMSFVRKDLVETVKIASEPFPVEGLDFPNKTDRPDIDMGDILKHE